MKHALYGHYCYTYYAKPDDTTKRTHTLPMYFCLLLDFGLVLTALLQVAVVRAAAEYSCCQLLRASLSTFDFMMTTLNKVKDRSHEVHNLIT